MMTDPGGLKGRGAPPPGALVHNRPTHATVVFGRSSAADGGADGGAEAESIELKQLLRDGRRRRHRRGRHFHASDDDDNEDNEQHSGDEVSAGAGPLMERRALLSSGAPAAATLAARSTAAKRKQADDGATFGVDADDDDVAYVQHELQPHHTLAGIALQYRITVWTHVIFFPFNKSYM